MAQFEEDGCCDGQGVSCVATREVAARICLRGPGSPWDRDHGYDAVCGQIYGPWEACAARGGLKWLGLYFGGIERFTHRAGAGGDGSAENGKFAGKAVDRARPKVEGHPTKDAILCSL